MLQTVLNYAPQAYKALTALALGVSTSYGGVKADGVTGPEWVWVVLSGLIAAVGVWVVPNKTAT